MKIILVVLCLLICGCADNSSVDISGVTYHHGTQTIKVGSISTEYNMDLHESLHYYEIQPYRDDLWNREMEDNCVLGVYYIKRF